MAKRPVWSWSDVKTAEVPVRLTLQLDATTYKRLVRMADAAASTTAELATALIRSVVEDDADAHGEGT